MIKEGVYLTEGGRIVEMYSYTLNITLDGYTVVRGQPARELYDPVTAADGFYPDETHPVLSVFYYHAEGTKVGTLIYPRSTGGVYMYQEVWKLILEPGPILVGE